MTNICPTQFALAVKEAGEPFADVLTDDELLNLADPTKTLDSDALSSVTEALNKKTGLQRVMKPPATVTGSDFIKKYPKLNERLEVGPISTAEVAIFATETGAALDGGSPGQVSLDMSDWTPGAQIPANVDTALTLMSDFFDENIGASLSSGQCAAFALKVGVIGGLLQSLKAKADSLGDIPGFNLPGIPSIDEILEQLKSKLALEGIKKSLEDTIDKVLDKVKKQGSSILAGLDNIDQSVKDAANAINAFTSDKNKDGMMDGVEKMIANLSSGFEKLDAKALGLLMFRLCQVSEAIQSSSEKPLEKLIATASAADQTRQAAKSMSAKAGQSAVDSGATRMDPADVNTKREDIRDTKRTLSSNVWDMVEAYKQTYGENNDGIGMSNDLTLHDVMELNLMKSYPKVKKARHLPKSERAWVKALQTDTSITGGIGPIKFQGAYSNTDGKGVLTHVDKAGRDTGSPGPGWTNVHESLWVQLIDMARQLGTDITVTHAWKYETRNKLQKKGYAVKIVYDDNLENALAYTIAASRAGVKEIITDTNEMVLYKAPRDWVLGKGFWQRLDNVTNTTLPNSQARIDGLNTLSSFAVKGALRWHKMDNWQYYVAPAVGASAPPTAT